MVGGPRSHELSSVDSCGKLKQRAPLDLLWIIKKEMKQAKLPWESPQWSHETDGSSAWIPNHDFCSNWKLIGAIAPQRKSKLLKHYFIIEK